MEERGHSVVCRKQCTVSSPSDTPRQISEVNNKRYRQGPSYRVTELKISGYLL